MEHATEPGVCIMQIKNLILSNIYKDDSIGILQGKILVITLIFQNVKQQTN